MVCLARLDKQKFASYRLSLSANQYGGVYGETTDAILAFDRRCAAVGPQAADCRL